MIRFDIDDDNKIDNDIDNNGNSLIMSTYSRCLILQSIEFIAFF